MRAMSPAQRKICGCENCIVTKMLHHSLIQYRRQLSTFSKNQSNQSTTRSINEDNNDFENYQQSIINNNKLMILKVREIIPIITCGFIGDKGVPLYQCSSGNCPSSPKYHPHILESAPRSNFPLIHFITNQKHTKCKIHGILAQSTKPCQHCESQSQECNSF